MFSYQGAKRILRELLDLGLSFYISNDVYHDRKHLFIIIIKRVGMFEINLRHHEAHIC